MGQWRSPLEAMGLMGMNGNTPSGQVEPTFWQGKTVFLTGHTGFKGGWLGLWLASMGAKVTGYALAPNTTPNLFTSAQIENTLVHSYIADLRDSQVVLAAIQAAKPEIVIHMAAQPLVRYSYHHPLETYATNVMGTAHVLDAVRNTPGVRAVVVVTTDKCYENREWVWAYRENEPMGGYDPYSSSKGCAELVSAAYRQSYFSPTRYLEHGVALATARAGNVIGGGDWSADRLIPDAIRAFEAQQDLVIRNPLATRPWQHVLEPLAGYLVLAQALYEQGPRFNGAWNFGPKPDDARTVEAVINAFVALWPHPAQWVQDPSEQPHEAQSLQLDCAKAQHELHWRPRWNLEEALMRIRDWHLAAARKADLRQLSLTQIAEYQSTHSLNSF
jgi:CDP-glucose 4,6-dehydratase